MCESTMSACVGRISWNRHAFDTIHCDKPLDILQTFLGELQMNCFLLSATSLELRLSTGECSQLRLACHKVTASVRCCCTSNMLTTLILSARHTQSWLRSSTSSQCVWLNVMKTKHTSVSQHADHIEEEWRMTCKLGSLLGEAEDVTRRKQLANVTFRKLWTVWLRRYRFVYSCCYGYTRHSSMLSYNIGTYFCC